MENTEQGAPQGAPRLFGPVYPDEVKNHNSSRRPIVTLPTISTPQNHYLTISTLFLTLFHLLIRELEHCVAV